MIYIYSTKIINYLTNNRKAITYMFTNVIELNIYDYYIYFMKAKNILTTFILICLICITLSYFLIKFPIKYMRNIVGTNKYVKHMEHMTRAANNDMYPNNYIMKYQILQNLALNLNII